MNFGFEIDTSELEKRFGLTEKNIAFAAVNATNETAKQIQKQAQANVRSKFTIRKSDFMMRQAAIIKPFASVTQGRAYAEIAVGQKPRLLLADFERGASRPPFIGKNVAMPIPGSPARPSFSDPVAMPFTSLGLHPVLSADQATQRKALKGGTAAETRRMRKEFTHAAGHGRPWIGNQRTYMIPGLGVFQRTGPKKTDTVMIYKFVPTQRLIPRLGFLAMAKQDGRQMFITNMETAVINEISRKRG